MKFPALLPALLSLLLWPTLAFAQQPQAMGRFCLLNALPEMAVSLSLDEQALSDQELQSGVSTGQWPAKAGKHSLGIQWGEGEEQNLSQEIELEAGKTLYLILYAEYALDEETGEEILQPTLLELPADYQPSKLPAEPELDAEAEEEAEPAADQARYQLTLLWVGKAPQEQLQLNRSKLTLDRLEFAPVPKWRGQPLVLQAAQEPLGRYQFSEAGSFLALLFDQPSGEPKLLFQRLLP